MKKTGKIIFVADAHIMNTPTSSDGFFDLLGRIGESDCDIVFLGDIFELWIAFDSYEEAVHRRFLEWCRREKEKRMIGFLEGNHEFYVSNRHAEAFTWCSEKEYCLPCGKICLTHGDCLNKNDFPYLIFRGLMRNPVTRLLIRLSGPLIGRPLSRKILRGLKDKNMKHKKNFPEKYFHRLADSLQRENRALCIMGHFHQPAAIRGIHVLPAWEPEDGEIGVYDRATEQYYRVPWRNFFPEKGQGQI